MSAEDWPDFWLKGKYIDWIETVNLVKTINTIGTIGTVETIETLETLNTVGTIQKINPKTVDSTTYNTVIDLIEKIKQIDNITDVGTLGTLDTVGTIQKINPQTIDSTEYNTVLDYVGLINQINTINSIGTLGTVNSVGTVDTISKINPQNGHNVVIDLVDLINTINTINRINVIHDARIIPNLIQNGSFRTSSLEGWYKQKGDEYVEYDETYQDYVCVLPTVNSGIAQFTQPILGNLARIVVRYNHEVDNGEIEIIVQYRDGTADAFDFTATSGGTWYDAVVEPTTNKPIRGIAIYNMTSGSKLRVTGIEMLKKPIIYQAEKDRQISREGTVVHFAKSFSAAGSSNIVVPASGKALRILAWNFYCDADVTCELRFANSGNVIAGLPAKGATAMNLVGCTAPAGSPDEPIEIYVSDAANVKGWICVEEV